MPTLLVATIVASAFLTTFLFPTSPPPSKSIVHPVEERSVGSPVASPTGLHFDYILIILMENHAICNILTSCGGKAPYMTGLASANGLATHYVDCTKPSLPNYLCLTGGTDFGCTGYDGSPHSNTCTNVAWGSPNIADRLEAGGLSWKAYMDDMPHNCSTTTSGLYAVKHDPFVYYGDVVNNATRCGLVIPAGSSDDALLDDLNSTSTASNYMWLTPNLCNDMHDCNVTTGDTYLSGLVPQILNSTVFRTQRAALFLTFDEDSSGAGAPYLYTVWAGPVAKSAYTSSAAYNHFSLLATLESNWNLTPLTSNDSAAANMNEFFVTPPPPPPPQNPTARFNHAPAWPQVAMNVTFNGSASTAPDPNSSLQFRWDWTDDGSWDTTWSASPIADHPYGSAGVYTAALQVRDTNGTMNETDRQVPVDGAAPVTTASLSGAQSPDGWFTGNVTVTLTASDDLSGVSSTDYSVDGGAWQAYQSPFGVGPDGNHTIRANSTDNAGNVETTESTSFQKDGTPPVSSATFAGTVDGGVFVTPIVVTLESSDATSGVAVTRYWVDGGPWTNYTAEFTVDENGSHTVDYRAADVAGNVESPNSFAVLNGSVSGVNLLSSTATFEGTLGSANWYTSAVNVTLALVNGTSPPDSISYRLDGGAWTLLSASFMVTGEGIHPLEYNATNHAGVNELTHSATIQIDTAPPASDVTLSGTLGDNGWYVSNVTVTLTATDATSGIAGISYRVDSGAWTAYASPFLLSDGPHVLQSYATDRAGLVEAAHSTSVAIDTNVPVTVATLSGTLGDNGWYTSNVSVTLSAFDAQSGIANVSYRVDNGSWTTYSGVFTLSDGDHFVEYYATDLAGLVEPVEATTVLIDTSLLRTTITLSGILGNDGWYVSDVIVTLSATGGPSGIANISVRLDNGSWGPYSSSFSLSDGQHIVQYYATDVAGHVEPVETTNVWIDTVPPATDVTFSGTLGDHGWYITNVTVTLSAVDTWSGVLRIAYRVDSGLWETYSGPFVLGDGAHVLQYYATDVAGLVEPVGTTNVWIDASGPDTTATISGTPGDNGWFISNVTFGLNATDGTSGVASISYRVDNGSWVPYAGPFVLSEGRHLLEYFATDVAGNVEGVETADVSIDMSPPTTDLTLSGTPGDQGWYISNMSGTLTAFDAGSGVATVACRVDSGPWVPCPNVVTFTDGQHSLDYFATDVAGLSEAVHSTSIFVDTTPPATSESLSGTLGNNGWYMSNVTVFLSASDGSSGVASIWYRVDTGPWLAYSGGFILDDGQHALQYYAIDVAGLIESVHSAGIWVDATPPTVAVVLSGSGGSNGWYISDVSATLSASDAGSGVAGIWFRTDGSPWLVYSSALTLSDGPHILQFRATDVAGVASATQSTSIWIDTRPPALGIDGPADGSFSAAGTVAVTWTASDGTSGLDHFEVRIDGDGPISLSGTAYTFASLADGSHTFAVTAFDRAGHSTTVSVSVIVDTTPPSVAITSPMAGAVVAFSHFTMTWTAADATSGINHFDVSFDGGPVTALPATSTGYTFTGLSDGLHTVRLDAVDWAGNAVTTSADVMVDTVVPLVSITAPANGAVLNSSSTMVTWAASDAMSGIDHVTILVDSGEAITLPATATSHRLNGLIDGSHTVTVTVFDRAGHSATSTVMFRVSAAVSPAGGYEGVQLTVVITLIILAIAAVVVFLIRRSRGPGLP